MPPSERRALLLLLALGVAGQGVRYLATRPGDPPGQVQLLATLSPGSPLAQRDSAMHRARPLASGEMVNLDSANAGELARLPKIGAGLARTIIGYRQQHGPFGNLAGLDKVPGVGPGLLKVIAPHVSFGATLFSAPAAIEGRLAGAATNINTATGVQLDALPGIGPAKAATILQYRTEHGPFATVDDLAKVPGFGTRAVARLRDRLSVR
jgi:competence ComEA-like helix-hairpin-helix protein